MTKNDNNVRKVSFSREQSPAKSNEEEMVFSLLEV